MFALNHPPSRPLWSTPAVQIPASAARIMMCQLCTHRVGIIDLRSARQLSALH